MLLLLQHLVITLSLVSVMYGANRFFDKKRESKNFLEAESLLDSGTLFEPESLIDTKTLIESATE